MKVLTTDFAPVLRATGEDIIKKLASSNDVRNAARIFAISCMLDDQVLLPLLDNYAKHGVMTLPNKETALNAMDKAGGVLAFPLDLPLGFSFTISLNRSDLERMYTQLQGKEVQ